MARLSHELTRYCFEQETTPYIQFADLLSITQQRIFGFLFVIIALPSALPIPAPGYSIPFGIVMFLLAMQLILGAKEPWLPQRIRRYQLELQQVQYFVTKGTPWLKRLESVTRPRFTYLCTSSLGRVILGSAIALMSVSMMVPIPGTNTLPAISIFVMGFGLQEDDGLISLMGFVIAVIAAMAVMGIIMGGMNLFDLLIQTFQNL